jgi:hypothetical protein
MRHPRSTSGIMQLVTRRAVKGTFAESQFFTTWPTVEAGQWRGESISALLQVAPSRFYGFRSMVQEFHALRPLQAAIGISQANPQFGIGGGERIFIPYEDHPTGLEPLGEPIPLGRDVLDTGAKPKELLADIVALELSLGNELLAVDRTDTPSILDRFWMQETLHFADIEARFPSSPDFERFDDPDPHGSVCGYISRDLGQVLLSPLQDAERPSGSSRRSWWKFWS